MRRNWKLVILTAIFAAVTGAFVWKMAHAPRIVGIKIKKTFAKADMNPIEKALVYGIPEPEFEELVNTFESASNSTDTLTSVLVDCSSLGRTNYARILINHGASIDGAIAQQAKHNNERAIQMLSWLRGEAATTRELLDRKK